MNRVLDSVPEHVDAIQLKKVHLDDPDVIANAKGAIRGEGHTITLLAPTGEVMAIIGCQLLYRNTAEFWALTSPLCEKYPITFYKSTTAMLDSYIQERGLIRTQMTVKAAYKAGVKWAQKLGFQCEGVLRSYGPDGSDYVMMGRVS